MKVVIVGTGYVGLVSGVCFAEIGHEVMCVDVVEEKINKLRQGISPIYEPGIEEFLKRNIDIGTIGFTTKLSECAPGADVIFMALPTPPQEDGSADLKYVKSVANQLGPMLSGYTVIVNKSTVPVGTAEEVSEKIAQSTKAEFDVVSNPEFLREGHALSDFMAPDRVVIGANNEKAFEIMRRLYQPIEKDTQIIEMDVRSAELTKYAANAFLALKITYANEIANLCEKLGADMDAVKQGIGSDSRIGSKFINPGIGYGGSCFPKDTWALTKIAESVNCRVKTIDTTIEVNDEQKKVLVEKLVRHFNGDINGLTIGVWGLAFKPDTDDVREAPAGVVIKELLRLGATVVAYDPEANDTFRSVIAESESFKIVESAKGASKDVDALLICTEWPEFSTVDVNKIVGGMKQKVIIDGRNIFHAVDIPVGTYYESIGRTAVNGK